jgi:hypothetical protein
VGGGGGWWVRVAGGGQGWWADTQHLSGGGWCGRMGVWQVMEGWGQLGGMLAGTADKCNGPAGQIHSICWVGGAGGGE